MIKRLKFFIYSIVLYFSTNKNTNKKNRVLIVKTDEIGDYVLWRGCGSFFKTSTRFKDYSITLCGNKAWKKIADHFDENVFDNYIWLDKKKFKSNMWYRFRFLKKINQKGFSVVINPIFSRGLRPDDSIVIAAAGLLNIGMIPNKINIEPFEEGYDLGLYHELINISDKNIFEFYRNKLFTEKILESKITNVQFKFDKTTLKKLIDQAEKYFIVFPGSSNPSRIWNTANFIEVAKFVQTEYNYMAIVCGGPSDSSYIESFINNYPYPCHKFVEKEGLADFINALAFAQLIISVDTGAVHLAAAAGCPVYGIFNGSFYGRFAPYPAEIAQNFYAIYPDSFEQEILTSNTVTDKYLSVVKTSYNEVTPQKVILKIKSTLNLYV